jgi:hypothetical protein
LPRETRGAALLNTGAHQKNAAMKKLSSIRKLSMVEDRLFVGNRDAAKDAALLHRLRITHIVNIGGGANRFPSEFLYHKEARVSDSAEAALLPLLAPACLFIDKALGAVSRSGKKVPKAQRAPSGGVLVHCKGGISRSPAIVCAYLLHSGRARTVDEALAVVRKARPPANPNKGFMRQLRAFEEALKNAVPPPHQGQ